MVKDNFTDPDFFRSKFPAVLDGFELFPQNDLPSYFFSVDCKILYDLNLMREYSEKDIDSFLNKILLTIGRNGALFGINGYVLLGESASSGKNFLLCFYGGNNKILKIDLLRSVFNKYIKYVLSENTIDSVMNHLKSSVLEKIILEESIFSTSVEHKKNKI